MSWCDINTYYYCVLSINTLHPEKYSYWLPQVISCQGRYAIKLFELISYRICVHVGLCFILPVSAYQSLYLCVAYLSRHSWNECDDKVIQAAKDGVNVVIWFAINLVVDPVTGRPRVQSGLNYSCVADVARELRELNLPTIHLISIGYGISVCHCLWLFV